MSTGTVVRSVDLSNATWYHGCRYSYLIRSNDTGGAFAVFEVFQRRGVEPPPHVHHAEDEIFLIPDSGATLQVVGDTFTAQPGAFAFLPRGLAHRYAVHNDWARMLAIVIPGGFENYLTPFSVPATHLDEPPAPATLDVAGLIARGAQFGIEFVPPDTPLAAMPSVQPEGLEPVVRQTGEGELLNVLGITVRVKLNALESGGAASVFTTEDPARTGVPLHIHRNEDETIYVIEGSYKLRVDDDITDARPGQIAHFPRGVPHSYSNAGDTTGRLMIMTTPGGYEAFFRDVDALCRTGMPATEQVVAVGAKHRLEILGPPLAL